MPRRGVLLLVLLVLLVVVVLPALYTGYRIVANGVALSDDSFVYIDKALAVREGLAPGLLRPEWFAPGYGVVLGLFLAIDAGPIGAASWLNATALLVMVVALAAALHRTGVGSAPVIGLTACAVFTTGVTWPFRYAWSEPLLMAVSSLHLLGLVRYTYSRNPWDLGLLVLTAAASPWIRYAGMNVFVPLFLYGAWDLARAKGGRGARAATYLAGFLLAIAVPVLNPGRFGPGAQPDASPDEPAIPAAMTAMHKLLTVTMDAVGPGLSVGLVVSLLAATAWLLATRGRGLVAGSAPEGNRRPVEHLAIVAYTLVWGLAYLGICSHRLMRVTHMEQPIDPFIEPRFMAVALPWTLAFLGATWALLREGEGAWGRRSRTVVAVLAFALPAATFATEGRAWARTLFPGRTAFPFQWGYAGQFGRTPAVVRTLREIDRGGAPVPIALWCPAGNGCFPEDYFGSVFFLPHRGADPTSSLAFDVRPASGPTGVRFDLRGATPSGVSGKRFAYLASTASLPPEEILDRLSGWASRDIDRFVLLTMAHPQVPEALAEFGRLGYDAEVRARSGGMVWIRIERGATPAGTDEPAGGDR